MKSGLSFLLAARRSEIDALGQLARTSALVDAIAQLVHALQRERGLSSVLLASAGQRFGPQRLAQVGECLRLEHAVRAAFDTLQAERQANGARLFSRIAWVLPGFDALPALRVRVAALGLTSDAATAAFAKLIAGLLAVVFEAADGATDPDISRLLAAMFNFMQAKEFAGQERACGAAAFTAGSIGAERQQQWLQLIAAQERCFAVFVDFAAPPLRALWAQRQPSAEIAELERLRRVACVAPMARAPRAGPARMATGGIATTSSAATTDSTAPDVALDGGLSTVWFDCCSLRIDAMQDVETELCSDLRALCLDKIAEAEAEAGAQQAVMDQLLRDERAGQAAPLAASDAFFAVHHAGASGSTLIPAAAMAAAAAAEPLVAPTVGGGGPGWNYGHQLERSILDMLQEQSRRVQQVSDELQAVREALNERKLVERAKGLLMAHRKLSEADAHKMLRQTAMNQNRRLVDVAESVLSLAEYLPASA